MPNLPGLQGQRSKTYGVFTEVYHDSARQRELRKEENYSLKSCLDFKVNPNGPKLTKTLFLEGSRVRATESRHLADWTPSPAYLTEWVAALQLDILTRGE